MGQPASDIRDWRLVWAVAGPSQRNLPLLFISTAPRFRATRASGQAIGGPPAAWRPQAGSRGHGVAVAGRSLGGEFGYLGGHEVQRWPAHVDPLPCGTDVGPDRQGSCGSSGTRRTAAPGEPGTPRISRHDTDWITGPDRRHAALLSAGSGFESLAAHLT
jgi:hypothetical protein